MGGNKIIKMMNVFVILHVHQTNEKRKSIKEYIIQYMFMALIPCIYCDVCLTLASYASLNTTRCRYNEQIHVEQVSFP